MRRSDDGLTRVAIAVAIVALAVIAAGMWMDGGPPAGVRAPATDGARARGAADAPQAQRPRALAPAEWREGRP